MKSFSLTLSFPIVTGNHTHQLNRRTGRPYPTKRWIQYKAMIAADIVQAKLADPELRRILPLHEKFDMTIQMFPPDRRRRDHDNHIKAAADALTKAGLWADDSLIGNKLTLDWGEPTKPGYVLLTITLREKLFLSSRK